MLLPLIWSHAVWSTGAVIVALVLTMIWFNIGTVLLRRPYVQDVEFSSSNNQPYLGDVNAGNTWQSCVFAVLVLKLIGIVLQGQVRKTRPLSLCKSSLLDVLRRPHWIAVVCNSEVRCGGLSFERGARRWRWRVLSFTSPHQDLVVVELSEGTEVSKRKR